MFLTVIIKNIRTLVSPPAILVIIVIYEVIAPRIAPQQRSKSNTFDFGKITYSEILTHFTPGGFLLLTRLTQTNTRYRTTYK